MLSDEYHTVTNSIASSRERKSSLSKGLCFCERYAELRFWCQKWSEVVWMDGRQSGVQKNRLGNFQCFRFLYKGEQQQLIWQRMWHRSRGTVDPATNSYRRFTDYRTRGTRGAPKARLFLAACRSESCLLRWSGRCSRFCTQVGQGPLFAHVQGGL